MLVGRSQETVHRISVIPVGSRELRGGCLRSYAYGNLPDTCVAFFQAALFVYYQLIEWVHLFPWNNVRRGNGQEKLDLYVAVILSVLMLATWRRMRWAMTAGVALFGLCTWLQIRSWWLPYFRGASPEWKRTYGRLFDETIKFLPSDGVHLPPDACHVVLQL